MQKKQLSPTIPPKYGGHPSSLRPTSGSSPRSWTFFLGTSTEHRLNHQWIQWISVYWSGSNRWNPGNLGEISPNLRSNRGNPRKSCKKWGKSQHMIFWCLIIIYSQWSGQKKWDIPFFFTQVWPSVHKGTVLFFRRKQWDIPVFHFYHKANWWKQAFFKVRSANNTRPWRIVSPLSIKWIIPSSPSWCPSAPSWCRASQTSTRPCRWNQCHPLRMTL